MWGTEWIGDFLYCWILQEFFLSKIEEPIMTQNRILYKVVSGIIIDMVLYGIMVDV